MSHTIWLTGLSGSGKSTIAEIIKKKYGGYVILDGDILRAGLNSDLGFSIEDRSENIRRIIELCRILNENGINVITAFITPLREMRRKVQIKIENCSVISMLISLDECKKRDPKGLYKKAISGEIKDFTGIDSIYENGGPGEYSLYTECPIDVTKLELFDIVERIQKEYE